MVEPLDALARAQAQMGVALLVSSSPFARAGDVGGLCRSLTQWVVERLDIDRVGVWLCDGVSGDCVCQDLYARDNGLHARGAVLHAHVPIDGPASMLCADVLDGENRIGSITFERQGGKPDWSPDYSVFVDLLCAQVAQALRQQRSLAEIAELRGQEQVLAQRVQTLAAQASQQKEHDTEQRRQSAYFRAVLDQLPQAVSVFDENLKLRYWNDGFINAQGLGLEMQAVYVGAPIEELFRIVAKRGEYGPGDVEKQVAVRKALAQRFEPHSFERARPDGRTLLIKGEPITIDGTLAGMVTTYTDISKRKKDEEDLRALNDELLEKSQLLQTTLTSISQGIVLFDAERRVRTFNPRACELLDIPESMLAGCPSEQDLVRYQLQRGDFGPDAQLVDLEARRDVIDAASGQADLPSRYLRQTRAGRTLEIRTQVLSSGVVVRTYADVSDYVQAEAARLRLNQLLDATQTIARVGGWERDFVNGTAYWTEGVYRILEVSPQEYTPGDFNSTQRFFTPEARKMIRPAGPTDVAATATTHDMELEMVTWLGRHIWVRFMGTTTWDQGRPVKRTSVLQDITERRETEAALRASEERWKLALDSTGDGVWDWRIQTGEEFFSPRLMEMTGYSDDDIRSRADAFDKHTDPDDMPHIHKARQDHFEGRTPSYRSERRLQCKDGSWKRVLSRGMVVERDAQGLPLRMVGTFTDVTEFRKQEAALRESLAARKAVEATNLALEQLGAIGREITGHREQDAIFSVLDRHVHALLAVSEFTVYRLEFDGRSLKRAYAVGTQEAVSAPVVPVDDAAHPAARCARDQTEVIANAEADHTTSMLLTPLMVGERLLGVMSVQTENPHAYGERERLIFRTMGAYAAIALANTDAQAQMIHSEKMASLGQLVANVAHEINTPISAIKSSGESIADALGHAQEMMAEFGTLDQETRLLFTRLMEHARTHSVMLSSREARAVVREVTRQLAEAGTADADRKARVMVQLNAQTVVPDYLGLWLHPRSDFILRCVENSAAMSTGIDNINLAVERVSKIVFALKSYSRSDANSEMQESDLREGLDTVLTIYNNQIKQGIELVRNYDAVPPLRCLPDELNQVWTNLIHNALQAMHHKGTLTITVGRDGGEAVVSVGDTGCGIPQTIRGRIFDPFFTTKPTGEGSGLGLDIVKKIVDKHQGRIAVQSTEGVGTLFSVYLPLQRADA